MADIPIHKTHADCGDAVDSDRELAGIPAPDAQVTLFLSLLERMRQQTRASVAALSPDDLQWTPPGGLDPIGRHLWYVAQAELWWIRECFGGVPADDDLWRTVGIDASTGAALDLPDAPVDAYLAGLERVRHETRRILDVSRDSALNSAYQHPRDADGRPAQGRWILFHVLQHEASHLGQIAAIRRLRRALP